MTKDQKIIRAKAGLLELAKQPATSAKPAKSWDIDRVIPFFEEHGVPPQRVLTDRGTEFCSAHDRHEYELYLAVENIDPHQDPQPADQRHRRAVPQDHAR